jgi:hypothetical protein
VKRETPALRRAGYAFQFCERTDLRPRLGRDGTDLVVLRSVVERGIQRKATYALRLAGPTALLELAAAGLAAARAGGGLEQQPRRAITFGP